MRYALVLVVALALSLQACNNTKPNQPAAAADPTLPSTGSPTAGPGDTYTPSPTPIATKPPLKTPGETPVPTPKAGGRTYTIKAHDNLYSIAREELKDVKRWKEIQTLNPDLDPAKLPIGKTINLPPEK